jgi:precorrin-6Y C5,15-methyltransferase (decarboxylating)
MKFIVIGITDNPQPFFPPEVLEIIKNGTLFSGGMRHHEIVAPLLPADAEWIDITVPLDAVFEQYKSLSGETAEHSVVVFASGDPLFFGFANTIRKRMPEADIELFPTFNSLQMLAHRLVMPYHDLRIVSLTGRPWPEFDKALIERAKKIGILTDKEHTPAAIAQRMLDYGYSNYTMYVGEHLGNPTKEKVTTLTLEEVAHRDFSMPNCVILKSTQKALGPQGRFACEEPSLLCTFGIPDSDFTLLDGREKMITKMPIRLLTLQALDLPRRHVLWDIGACTGSVSIEARLQFPHLHIEAFEIRPECEAIINENARCHGAPGIALHIGDFLACCNSVATNSPHPDAVFIGGHGGHLKEILQLVLTVLAPGGVIVMNSVSSPVVDQMTSRPSSRQLWDEACRELGLQQEPPLRIQLNDYNPIEILKATQKR